MKHVILYLSFFSLLVACKKDEISSSFDAASGIYFVYNVVRPGNIDSIGYSFAEKSSTTLSDTLWLPVRISGGVTDHDRVINLVADPSGTTAVQDKHYKLLDYVLPKGSFTTQLGVVLLRDASLLEESVVLDLHLQPSADFGTLMKDTLMADGRFYSTSKVKIIFTDRLLKPDNWDSYLLTFFGPYSNVKFRFISGLLGVSSFLTTGANPVNFPLMQFYQNTVRNALAEYALENGGPLLDENDNIVVIP